MEAPLRLHERVGREAAEEGLQRRATLLDEVGLEDAVVLEGEGSRKKILDSFSTYPIKSIT